MTGRRNDRHFRVIVTEHTAGPKSGKYVEKLGFINPRTGEKKIDAERAKYWLSVGAKPSGRVHNMLVDEKVIDAPKINVLPKKTPIVNETEEGQNASDASEAQGAEASAPDTGAQAEDANASDNSDTDAGQSDSDNKEETTQETPTEEPSANNEQSEDENTSNAQESDKEKEGE